MKYIEAEEFLERIKKLPVIDVRSPSEFQQGHIPGAFNIALFNDVERKRVGTLYKNSGKESSVLLGLDIVGPKMSGFVKAAIKIAPKREILIHCWRGGMRSASMAWLFETAGFKVSVLKGGYKAYRRFIRLKLEENMSLIVLGGKTGSGKSDILNHLALLGEQVLDLEGIAHHKGSAFGAFGQGKQPTSEQFENNIYLELIKFDLSLPVWVEDESRAIGLVSIPEPLYKRIRESVVIFLDINRTVRVKRLVKEYALFDKELLNAAVSRIEKRLGGLNTKTAIEAININDFETAASILLSYYDKAYLKGLSGREQKNVYRLELLNDDPGTNAYKVMEYFKSLNLFCTKPIK